jgi:hypothetical protein
MKYAVCLSSYAVRNAKAILDSLMPGLPIEKALEVELNPSGRGILVTKDKDEPLRARLWGNHLVLPCRPLSDSCALYATTCYPLNPATFAGKLTFGEVVRGAWIFTKDTREPYPVPSLFGEV